MSALYLTFEREHGRRPDERLHVLDRTDYDRAVALCGKRGLLENEYTEADMDVGWYPDNGIDLRARICPACTRAARALQP